MQSAKSCLGYNQHNKYDSGQNITLVPQESSRLKVNTLKVEGLAGAQLF